MMQYKYLVHVTGCNGEKHGRSPKSVDKTYLVVNYYLPNIKNTSTIRGDDIFFAGLGTASNARMVFESYSLGASLLNAIQKGSTIEKLIIYETAVLSSSKPTLSVIAKFVHENVTIRYLTMHTAEFPVLLEGIQLNNFIYTRFDFTDFHASTTNLSTNKESNKDRMVHSNASGYGKSKQS